MGFVFDSSNIWITLPIIQATGEPSSTKSSSIKGFNDIDMEFFWESRSLYIILFRVLLVMMITIRLSTCSSEHLPCDQTLPTNTAWWCSETAPRRRMAPSQQHANLRPSWFSSSKLQQRYGVRCRVQLKHRKNWNMATLEPPKERGPIQITTKPLVGSWCYWCAWECCHVLLIFPSTTNKH